MHSSFYFSYLSDSWLGRFKTIVLGFILYILGFVLLTLISVDLLPRVICDDASTFLNNGNILTRGKV